MAHVDTAQAQRAGRQFINQAMKAPLLEREEEPVPHG